MCTQPKEYSSINWITSPPHRTMLAINVIICVLAATLVLMSLNWQRSLECCRLLRPALHPQYVVLLLFLLCSYKHRAFFFCWFHRFSYPSCRYPLDINNTKSGWWRQTGPFLLFQLFLPIHFEMLFLLLSLVHVGQTRLFLCKKILYGKILIPQPPRIAQFTTSLSIEKTLLWYKSNKIDIVGPLKGTLQISNPHLKRQPASIAMPTVQWFYYSEGC